MSTTSLPPAAHPVRALLDQLGGLLDQLTVAEVWTLGEGDLLAARVAVETQTTRLTAVRWALTQEIEVRGAAVSVGATSTTAWAVNRLRQAPGDAAREVRLAGQVTPDRLGVAHAALVAGEVSAAAVQVVAETDQQLAGYATVQDRAGAQASLVAQAQILTVPELRALATRIQVLLDPDQGDRLDRDEQSQRDREQLRLRRRPDGSVELAGYLGAESAAALDAALAPHLRPKPLPQDADGQNATVPRDTRSLAKRSAAALNQVVQVALAAPPRPGSPPVTLTVAISLDDLRGTHPHPGYGLLDTGLPLSVAAVRRLACDAQIIPVVLGAEGQPLDLGRATRAISPGLR